MPSNQIIKNQPPAYAPVYNILEVCVFEQDAPSLAMPNYKYIIEVIVTGHLTQKFFVPPEPKQNFGIQDVSRYVDQFVKEAIPEPTDNQFVNSFYQGEPEFLIEYKIQVTSGWDVAGVFTEDPDGVGPVISGALYAWSASFEEHDWIDQVNEAVPFDTWLLNTTNGADALFLTNYPSKKVQLNDLGWTYLLTDTPADVDRVRIETFDSTGASIAVFEVTNPIPHAVPLEDLLRMATGPGNLNMIIPGQFISGAQPIITSSVSTYTMQVFDNAANPSSELITFTIEEPCRYETYRLHFLNRLGGFDAYNFTFRSQPTRETKRKSYTKADNNVDVNGIRYDHKDNGTVDYNITTRNKVKLRSEYLTEAEHDWLQELVDSPTVYLEFTKLNGSRDFKGVRVTTNRWEQKILSIDKLFQLVIDIDLGLENKRQTK
jgi:hypothetical protein